MWAAGKFFVTCAFGVFLNNCYFCTYTKNNAIMNSNKITAEVTYSSLNILAIKSTFTFPPHAIFRLFSSLCVFIIWRKWIRNRKNCFFFFWDFLFVHQMLNDAESYSTTFKDWQHCYFFLLCSILKCPFLKMNFSRHIFVRALTKG